MMHSFTRLVIVLFLGIATLVGCSKNDPIFIGGENAGITLAVTPFDNSILQGTTRTFTAFKVSKDGTSTDVTSEVTWTSSATSIATINASGKATGLASGDSVITATLGSLSESVDLNVHNKTISSLVVTPPRSIAIVNVTKEFHAIAYFADASTQDVSESATWTTTNSSIATVENNGGILAKSDGTATVNAALNSHSGNARLDVLSASPTNLVISPVNATVIASETEAFKALLTLSDNNVLDITNDMLWSSSNEAVATVSNSSGRKGVSTGHSAGSSTISGAVSVGGSNYIASASLTVTEVTLTHLTVSPASADVVVGAYGTLHATAYYSDGSSSDVTNMASWQTNDSSIVKIGSGTFLPGFGYAAAAGEATITTNFGGIQVQTPIKVSNATLQSIQVSPSTLEIPNGANGQFSAIGLFSDGSKHDVTLLAHWSSSDPNIAVIDERSTGLVHSNAVGNSTITAQLNGLTGTGELTVNNATIVGLVITPDNSDVYLGGSIYYTATVTYSDASTQEVSYDSYWFSSDTNVLTFPGDGDYAGQSHGKTHGVGTTTVTAHYTDPTTNTAYTDTTLFTVTNAIVKEVAVTPKNKTQIPTQEAQLTAKATLSDSSIQDVTYTTTWTSTNPEVASVNRYGLVHSLKAGTTTIQATEGVYTDTSSWTVVDRADITSISISCSAGSVAVGSTMTCTGTGTDSTAKTFDISDQLNWVSSNTAIATVDNFFKKAGVVTGMSSGNTQISATFNALTSNSVTVTVP